MDNFLKEILLIVVKSIVSFVIVGIYALIRISIFGEDSQASMVESIIVYVVSIYLGCGIVNILFNQNR